MRFPVDDPALFFSSIRERFSHPLPGESAQELMSSRARLPLEEYLRKRPDHRISAVLMVLYPFAGKVHTLIIKRPSYDGVHSGQLALPGGKVEEVDESPLHTALRETREEVGVEISVEQIIGRLTPLYIPPSNFLVHPFVAWLDERPEWLKDEYEVEELLEVSVGEFLRDDNIRRERIPLGNNLYVDAPCFIIDGKVLWGATAMMFSEVRAMLIGK